MTDTTENLTAEEIFRDYAPIPDSMIGRCIEAVHVLRDTSLKDQALRDAADGCKEDMAQLGYPWSIVEQIVDLRNDGLVEEKTEPVDAETTADLIEAFGSVVGALECFSTDDAERIVRAACVLLDIEL